MCPKWTKTKGIRWVNILSFLAFVRVVYFLTGLAVERRSCCRAFSVGSVHMVLVRCLFALVVTAVLSTFTAGRNRRIVEQRIKEGQCSTRA